MLAMLAWSLPQSLCQATTTRPWWTALEFGQALGPLGSRQASSRTVGGTISYQLHPIVTVGSTLEHLQFESGAYPGLTTNQLLNLNLFTQARWPTTHIEWLTELTVVGASDGRFRISSHYREQNMRAPFVPEGMEKDFSVKGAKHWHLEGFRWSLGAAHQLSRRHQVSARIGRLFHHVVVDGGWLEARHPNGSVIYNADTSPQRLRWRGTIVTVGYAYLFPTSQRWTL